MYLFAPTYAQIIEFGSRWRYWVTLSYLTVWDLCVVDSWWTLDFTQNCGCWLQGYQQDWIYCRQCENLFTTLDFAIFHIIEDFVCFVDQQLTSDTCPKIFLNCVHINIAFNIIGNKILIVIAYKGDLLNFIFLKKNSFNLFELV